MGFALMFYTYVVAKRKGFPKKTKANLKRRLSNTFKALIPLGLPVVILGGITTGITTPTEAAVIGVFYALIITLFVYRTLTPKGIFEIVVDAGSASMAVGFTICTGVLFGWLATAEQLGPKLSSLIFHITDDQYVVILLINIILLLMGTVIEAIPIILLMTPILYPISNSLGMDPVQFGVMLCLNLMIGLLTPPIGLNLFVMSTIGKVSIEGIIKEVWPFLVILVLVLFVIVVFPATVLWLPNLLLN